MQRHISLLAVAATTAAMGAAAGCGRGGDESAAARPPSSGGTVLVMDGGTRATAPAALLGFVHGLHRFVIDGDRVFAGMTPLDAPRGPGGARTIALRDGLTAQLVPAGEGFELRFSSGETIVLREDARRAK